MPDHAAQSSHPTNPQLASLKSSLVSTITRLRTHFAQLGFSQCQFHHKFISHVFGVRVNQNEASAVLQSKIRGVSTVEDVESLLARVQVWEKDVQAVWAMESNRVIREEDKLGKQGKEAKNTQIVAKRKLSKDIKQAKKQKKHKADKNRKSKKVETGFVQLVSESDDIDNDISILKDRTNDLVNMLNQQPSTTAQQPQSQLNKAGRPQLKQNPFFQYPAMDLPMSSNSLFSNFRGMGQSGDQRNDRQNETIFQKLVQIQMLTRLLCAGSNPDSGQDQEDRVSSIFGMGY